LKKKKKRNSCGKERVARLVNHQREADNIKGEGTRPIKGKKTISAGDRPNRNYPFKKECRLQLIQKKKALRQTKRLTIEKGDVFLQGIGVGVLVLIEDECYRRRESLRFHLFAKKGNFLTGSEKRLKGFGERKGGRRWTIPLFGRKT